jgi:hypothetical protein
MTSSEHEGARLRLEAEENEIDKLERKMAAGSNLLNDKELFVRQLEMSLLTDNEVVSGLLN